MDKRDEVSYYPELADSIEQIIKSNISSSSINIKALYLPKNGSNIRSYLEDYIKFNENNVSQSLVEYAKDVPKVRTDIIILADNPTTNKFSIVILEVKLLGSMGLSELSQLIGYGLVTKIKYGILVNIKGGISSDLRNILLTDRDITDIKRSLEKPPFEQLYKTGVMSYNPDTRGFDYIETLSEITIPRLASAIEEELAN